MPDILIALVGNKCDLTDELVVGVEEAHAFARSCKAEIVKETSAKDNNGINQLFQEIADKLYKRSKDSEVRSTIFILYRLAAYMYHQFHSLQKQS